MKLRSRLDEFSTALLSALGASSVIACGGAYAADPGSEFGGAGNTAGATTNNGGSNTSGGTTTGTGTNRYPCKDPNDLGNGLIECDAFTHRMAAKTCTSPLPRPEPIPSSPLTAACTLDSQCTEKPHGWCASAGSGGSWTPGTTYCDYGCVTDSECGSGQLCMCSDPVGRCVLTADCAIDAQCLPGFFCKTYDSSGGCGYTTFTCQKPADECGSDSDCQARDPAVGNLCRYDDKLERFRCQPPGCIVGRPFLVEGEQRVAPVSARADWSALALLPQVRGLDTASTAHLAEQWTRMALLEHASIAAFARFNLQLLSLGAPPQLIELTTAAMADETKHAKACFALASQYAGVLVGPGRLAVEHSLDDSTLEQIALNAIREGCIGETLAALEAREAAEHATDPALRALLLEISADEARHAELAFRFVRWALTQGDATLERAVRAEFAALTAEESTFDQLAAREAESLRHGILPESMRQTIRARAIKEVILPCSNALYPSRVSRVALAALDTTAPQTTR
ncbi:MAG: ferritin-like domain-containing protein [Polyangiaceae bacterium]